MAQKDVYEKIKEVETSIEKVTEYEKLGTIDSKISHIKEIRETISEKSVDGIEKLLKLADIDAKMKKVERKLEEKAEKTMKEYVDAKIEELKRIYENFEKMHEMIDEVEKLIEEVTEVEKLGRIDGNISQIKDALSPSSIFFGKSIQMINGLKKLADINARIQEVKQKLDEKAEKILDDQIVKDCESVKLEYHVDPEISPISDQEKLLYFISMRPSKVNKP